MGRRIGALASVAALAALAALAACSHGKGDEAPRPQRLPLIVHVVNDNYLDMDVAAVIGGVSRNLGEVTGNTSRDLKLYWSASSGEPVTIMARPVGGTGSYVSPALNVGYGQSIFVHIGQTLRQSSTVLRASP